MDNITLISSPPAIALIGEGLNFELQRTTGATTGLASMALNFPDNQALYLDKYFEIALPGRNLKFYFKTTPDESGLQLRTWPSGMAYNAFLVQLIEDIRNNFYLNQDYIISRIDNTIHLIEARENGTAYNLNFVSSDITGFSEVTNTAGIDDNTPADYYIYVAACIRSDFQKTSIPLGEDFLPLDENDKAFPDIAEYIKDQLKNSFHFPFTGNTVFEVPDAVINYFIRYAEFQNDTFQKVYNTFAASKYAIAGGLKKLDSDYLKAEGGDYFSWFPERFLTWAPLSKLTHIDTPERLYFLTQTIGLKLKAILYFPDSTLEIKAQSITAAAFTVIEILCGVPEIFNNYNITNLQAYDIWIDDAADEAVSEIRHFDIDSKQYLNKRTIIFRNSFDKFDMLHCTGDLSISDNIKREEIQVLSNNTFRKQISLAENTADDQLASGWLEGKETRLWLEDLLLTKEIYLTIGDILFPIGIKTAKAVKQQDKEYLYQILIEFEPDYSDERYSNIITDGICYYTDENWEIYTDENDNKLIKSPGNLSGYGISLGSYLLSRIVNTVYLEFTPATTHFGGVGSFGSGLCENDKYIFIGYCDSFEGQYKHNIIVRYTKSTGIVNWKRVTTTNGYYNDNHKLPSLIITNAGTLLMVIEQLNATGTATHNSPFDVFRWADTDDLDSYSQITTNLTALGSYPFIFEIGSSIIIEFRRSITNYRSFYKSVDDGLTWSTYTDYIYFGDADYWIYTNHVNNNLASKNSVILAISPQNDALNANCYQYVTFVNTDFVSPKALDGSAFTLPITGAQLGAKLSWGNATKNTNLYWYPGGILYNDFLYFVGYIGTRTEAGTIVNNLQIVKVNINTGAVETGDLLSPIFGTTSIYYHNYFEYHGDIYIIHISGGSMLVYKLSADLNSLTLVNTEAGNYHADIPSNIYTNAMVNFDVVLNKSRILKL